MTTIDLVHSDLRAAAVSVKEAAGAAAASHGSGHISGAAAALPGSTSADMLTAMAPDWEADLRAWQEAADAFADSVSAHADDMSATDASAGARATGLRGAVTGGPR